MFEHRGILALCLLLGLICILELREIVRMRKQLSGWLADLKAVRRAPERKLFVKGSGILAEINYELNGILEEGRERMFRLQKAKEANRQLLTDLSHDVRTPLASLVGYLEALETRAAGRQEQEQEEKEGKSGDALAGNGGQLAEYLGVAYQKALDLRALIDMLFQWFKLEAEEQTFDLKYWDLNELTREVMIEQLPALEKEQISLTAFIPEEEWMVLLDKVAYARILQNIFQNAKKHGKCSELTIQVRRTDTWAEVTVSNDGAEIPKEELPFIFERMYKCGGARSGSGSGLGLSIVKELTKAMSGEITAKSRPGQTSFCLRFPCPDPL